nr:transporter [Enterobacter roggenkampii]
MKLAEIMNMELSKYFSPKKLGIYFLFLLLSWGLLYTWLMLVHRVDEKVASTLLSSPLIYGCITLSVVSLVIQNKAGAFIELLIIAFWLMVIFVYLIITFTVLLNAMPDIEDLIFYYECYLIIFFGNDSNLLIVFYVQIMPDDLVMQLQRF